MKAVNPFSHSLNQWDRGCRNVVMELPDRVLVSHRGVNVHKRCEGHYIFVLDGVVITERAGRTKAKSVIDSILDNPDSRNYNAISIGQSLKHLLT